MAEKTYYITTPIYYVNDVPHIGNASTTIACDVLSRFKRLQGRDVVFVTGTDENAIKVAEAAQAQGKSTQEYVDGIVPVFQEVWRGLHITNDVFIRTTEERHKKVVEHAFTKLLEQGDIYQDTYKGWYCVSDETFFREDEVTDGLCPNAECRKPVRWVEEQNYFFRLSAYGDKILKHIDENPGFLGPEFRRNEVVSFIKAGLRDACITRKAYGWGIPVPGEPDKVIYVWFDALLNYITAAHYLADDEKFNKTWPADVQLMGKDIFVRFHCTIWPAMLMALGVDLPKKIFAHGFWTIEGEKMSKSKGNAISPLVLAKDLAEMSGASVDIAVDAIRYFILREVTFGLDGDFSVGGLVGRFNSDLANDLGNLLNRTLPLLHRSRGGVAPKPSEENSEFALLIAEAAGDAAERLDNMQFSEALNAIWSVVSRANKYVDEQAPWRLAKDDSQGEKLDDVLYTVLETVRAVSVMVQPFMPSVSEAILRQLGVTDKQSWDGAGRWGGLKPGTQTLPPEPIFPRIDTAKLKAPEKPEEEKVDYISFEEFKKLDLRIGKIVTAAKMEGADKLLQLTVDIGSEVRPVVAGIAKWYDPEKLVGRQVLMIANLAPAKIRGAESRGMLLAADLDGEAVLLVPDKEVGPGSTVR